MLNSLGFMFLVVEWVISVGLAVRVLMTNRSVAASLGWIAVLLLVPVAGPLAYILVGEVNLGDRRLKRISELMGPYRDWLERVTREHNEAETEGEPLSLALSRVARRSSGIPPLGGNSLEVLDGNDESFQRLLEDIEAARTSIFLEFYIWQNGGLADLTLQALVAAQQRGVAVRALVDSVGGHTFLRSKACDDARAAGIEFVEVLPVGLFRASLRRVDLRMHRKIVVIDGRIGYTGSLNMVDGRLFKRRAGVGEWVDLMVRLEGPAVTGLAATWLADWGVEALKPVSDLDEMIELSEIPRQGDSLIQVLPSGPGYFSEVIYRTLLTVLYGAQDSLTITTPYFVPDDALIAALLTARDRGVTVTLILPAQVDSALARYASQAFYDELLEAGVQIWLYGEGMLHSKTITIDDRIALVGSVNFDQRSIWINHEISVILYDRPSARKVSELQQRYLAASKRVTSEEWQARPFHRRIRENVIRLASPLL